ncbi:MAG: DUF1643 domain-containing protein [Clostridiales bacterium]|nr:DUF1643 domain-containing protein [Clostridiales bacterium]
MDNTVIETVILETTAVFNEDQTKRYELTKEFKPNKDGKSIVVIMLNAASKNIQETDTTVNNLVNRLSCKELGFRKITILNLFPDIMTKLIPKKVDDLDINFTYIEEVLSRGYDNILVGYGNSFIGNKVVENAKYRLNQLLKNYEDILVEISDDDDTYDCSPMHPLFASMRLGKWVLKPYSLPKSELDPIVKEAKKPRKPPKNGLLAEGETKGDVGKKKAEKT